MRSNHGRLALLIAWMVLASAVATPISQGINRRGMLRPGESVPVLAGFGLDSRPITIDYRTQGKPTVVYVIGEHGGGYVAQNEKNFAAVVQQSNGRFAFVILCAVDTGELGATITRMRPAWRAAPVAVVANVSEELRQDMCLFADPQTLVISTEARVIENFHGAYIPLSDNAKPATIERFFGIKLPGTVR